MNRLVIAMICMALASPAFAWGGGGGAGCGSGSGSGGGSGGGGASGGGSGGAGGSAGAGAGAGGGSAGVALPHRNWGVKYEVAPECRHMFACVNGWRPVAYKHKHHH